jgi:hypothetical protein
MVFRVFPLNFLDFMNFISEFNHILVFHFHLFISNLIHFNFCQKGSQKTFAWIDLNIDEIAADVKSDKENSQQ